MFLKKNEKKGARGGAVALGALATLGAISVLKKGKALFCKAKEKMKGCLEKKADKMCEDGFSDAFSDPELSELENERRDS